MLKSLKEIMSGPAISGYTGSKTTRDMVASEIERRWGKKEVEKYNADTNCLTFIKWASLGHRIIPGQKAIRSFIVVEKKDKDGRIIKRFKHTIFLFYYKQVEMANV
ncbi:MAG: hypothetical protein Q7S43_02185 [bacterium]|nr:hypothetical protein [bacterium]